MPKIDNCRDLEIWQMGMDVTREIYSLTASFPDSERFGLTSQMRRAAVSIPSNIAEGFARRSRREFAHFLSITLGSIAELETQLTLARDLGHLDEAQHDQLLDTLTLLGKKTTLLTQRSERRKTSTPTHQHTRLRQGCGGQASTPK
jgi:four helix bundle protein